MAHVKKKPRESKSAAIHRCPPYSHNVIRFRSSHSSTGLIKSRDRSPYSTREYTIQNNNSVDPTNRVAQKNISSDNDSIAGEPRFTGSRRYACKVFDHLRVESLAGYRNRSQFLNAVVYCKKDHRGKYTADI
jgi:hypothetical protein